MINCINIFQSLFSQPFYIPAIIVVSLIQYYLFRKKKSVDHEAGVSHGHTWWVWFWALMVLVVFSAPFWFFGADASHSGPDDVAHTLHTYLSGGHRGDSFNWTNGLIGGMDRCLLPNSQPLSLAMMYTLFIPDPHLLYLFVITVNVILVFIFSWKIQTEFLKMRPWAAMIGSMVASISEGYWIGRWGEAHVFDGHGFSFVIVGIYWLTRFYQKPQFWLIAVLLGAAMATGSWIPVHNILALLVTMTIWGLVFWTPASWKKVLKANIWVLGTWTIFLLPYLLAIYSMFITSGRSSVVRTSVDLGDFYVLAKIEVLAAILIAAGFLKVYQEKLARQMLLVFLCFCGVPLLGYLFQVAGAMKSFRWELLYQGNGAWIWIAIIFFLERIYGKIEGLWRPAGLIFRNAVIATFAVLMLYAWMNSLFVDLSCSYPQGTLRAFEDTALADTLKMIQPAPVRVVGVGDSNDIHFWGEFQGMEPMVGYTPVIDLRKLRFWWFSVMFPLHVYNESFLSIPIPAEIESYYKSLDFPVDLSSLANLDALRVANVEWIVSHHPLYPAKGLDVYLQEPGDPIACHEFGSFLEDVSLASLKKYWDNTACIIKDYHYKRPFYVYRLQGDLPRAYVAAHVMTWPEGKDQNLALNPPQVSLAVSGGAFVDKEHWRFQQDMSAPAPIPFDTYQSDYMNLRIHVTGESLAVLNATLNPYWRVLVDSKKTVTFDVNGFQTGFWVSPQDHNAEFIYCPPWRLQWHPYCSRR